MNEKPVKTEEKTSKLGQSKPNEHGGFYFSSHIKISDPNTKQVFVQKRGDN